MVFCFLALVGIVLLDSMTKICFDKKSLIFWFQILRQNYLLFLGFYWLFGVVLFGLVQYGPCFRMLSTLFQDPHLVFCFLALVGILLLDSMTKTCFDKNRWFLISDTSSSTKVSGATSRSSWNENHWSCSNNSLCRILLLDSMTKKFGSDWELFFRLVSIKIVDFWFQILYQNYLLFLGFYCRQKRLLQTRPLF